MIAAAEYTLLFQFILLTCARAFIIHSSHTVHAKNDFERVQVCGDLVRIHSLNTQHTPYTQCSYRHQIQFVFAFFRSWLRVVFAAAAAAVERPTKCLIVLNFVRLFVVRPL